MKDIQRLDVLKKVPLNTNGRDFFIGDIHGAFGRLKEALKFIGFDKTKDRLFCCGDLIDRGPDEHMILDFVTQDWFFHCVGNHDYDFMVRDYLIRENITMFENFLPHEDFISLGKTQAEGFEDADAYVKKGMEIQYPFVRKLTVEQYMQVMEALWQTPLMVEVESEGGRIGLIHAEIPARKSWNESVEMFESNREKTRVYAEYAFWGDRARVIPFDVELLFETLFLLDDVTDKTREKIINATAQDLKLLFMGHNIMPLKTKSFLTEEGIRRVNRKTGHLKFIDHGAFVAAGMETDAYATVIYDDNGERVCVLDSIPL